MEKRRWIERSGQWALTASALAISVSAIAMPPNAAMLADACAGCHGTLGASAGPSMPSLAGQSKDAIVAAMKHFKSGERPSTVMGRLAKGYTDADFAAMGEFFARQKLHITQQALDPNRVTKGASLQASKCGGCHTENGKVNNDDAPAMASQWLPYLQMQMALYVDGKRKTAGMTEVIKTLSADDLESLLHFYASVK
jgi:sulfide dehydrogenase cytochrome subunit